ncbi:hypothetical protein ACFCYM_03550 [Streptomyces sp. NPDC056254]|uniref:hypothetical protein n=1 Tax=unclassified Streptomyces TaxID=2593676 RepID=UPI0004ABD2D6|nr:MULTISPECIES: hypothetical protein [unclassified Streptomyces]APU42152.1 hypothetical protein BSL84_22620 [Streptomyces sp. TN58]KJK45477.1 hypothetical protein UK14_25965 [Streptomyces sp. NRRL F-4428]
MSTLATRIAKTAAAAVLAGALGAAHAFTPAEPPQSPHSSVTASAIDFGSVTVPLGPQGDNQDPTDVTWGH